MQIILDASMTKEFPKYVSQPPVKNVFEGRMIVVISPHPDDTAVGCGAFIAALGKKNKTRSIILTSGSHAANPDIRKKETILEAEILGMEPPIFLDLPFYEEERQPDSLDEFALSKALDPIPDMIFLPSEHDSHQTHKVARNLTFRTLKELSKRKKISFEVDVTCYETPWGLFPYGKFNSIFPADDDTMRRKLEAIRVHKSQVERTQFVAYAKALAQLRASVIPEQALKKWGFGQKPFELGKYLEIYSIISKRFGNDA